MERNKILICTPVKNDAFYLKRHFKTWEKVDYNRENIRWIFIKGRSIDITDKILDNYQKKGKWNIEIYKELPFENPTGNALFIAPVLNQFRELYRNEDYVIIEDADIVKIPKNIIYELLRANKDLVAPFVYLENTKPLKFFDTYVFRTLNGKTFPSYPTIKSKKPIELQSVGTFYMVKGKIFKEVPYYNPIPSLQFCKNVRRRGYKIWALPYLKIFHANVLEEKGEIHYPLEWYIENNKVPKEFLEKV